jgi:hypothetical protein
VKGTSFTVDTTEIHYPVFEWAWNEMHTVQIDGRDVYYRTTGQYRHAIWDDGGERSQPEFGYIEFYMTFPRGTFLLSLYAYDYERNQRSSQEYSIYDETGTTLLASKTISGDIFNEGVYETFQVENPCASFTILLRVYNNAGHVQWTSPYPEDRSYNVVLSGIFVDLPSVGGYGTPIGSTETLRSFSGMALVLVIVTYLIISTSKANQKIFTS